MTYRALLIFLGVSALALAGLALLYAVRAVIHRARAGRPRVWGGLFFRGILIAGLLVIGMSSLENLPPPQMVNHTAPAAADATIALLQTPRDGNSRTVVGVSARDGATRWVHTFDVNVESLLSPSPEIILALTSSINAGLYALRASDGAVLWHSLVAQYMTPATMATDGVRVYAQVPAAPARGTGAMDILALDLQTGALVWRVPLPTSVRQAQRLAAGDGLVVVAGWAPGTATEPTTRVVMALRATDGAPQWSTVEPSDVPGGFEVQALFIMHGYAIVVPMIGPVTALRERDGVIAWTGTPNLEEPDNPPQINAATTDSDTIYLVWQPSHWATGADGRPIPPPVTMTAMGVGGTIHWHMTVQPASSAWSSLMVSDGVLLSGARVTASLAYGGYSPHGSVLAAYDAASGSLLWRDNTPPTGISWDMSPEISPWGGSGGAYLMGIQTDPYVQDRFQCALFCPGVSWLYAVNVHTGAPWWRVRMGYGDITRPFFVF